MVMKPAVGQDMTTQSSAPREELCSRASKVRADRVACMHLSYTLRNMQQRVMLNNSQRPLHLGRYDAKMPERWHSKMESSQHDD